MAGPRRRRRHRGGRPRAVNRGPSGRPAPVERERPAGPTPEILARRSEQVGPAAATDPDAEWLIGRLHISGLVTGSEREAARRFAVIVERYRHLLLAASSGPVPLRGWPRHPDERGRPQIDERDLAAARQRYAEADAALRTAGHEATRAVADALRETASPGQIDALVHGLQALARHFRLPNDRSEAA